MNTFLGCKITRDPDEAKKIAQKLTKEIGFVKKIALEDASKLGFLVVLDGVGFVNFRIRKDDQLTIYEIGVLKEHQRKGYGKKLIQFLRYAAIAKGKKTLLAKCPASLTSNEFYKKMGFVLKETRQGRKQLLNYWEMTL